MENKIVLDMDNKVLLELDEYIDLITNREELLHILNVIFDDSKLNYKGNKLEFDDDAENLMNYLRVKERCRYNEMLKLMQDEKERDYDE